MAGPRNLRGYFGGPAGSRSPRTAGSVDLVHAHGLTAGLRQIGRSLRPGSPPVVVTVHTSMRQTLRADFQLLRTRPAQTVLWAAARAALRRAAEVIVVSEQVRMELGFGVVVAPAVDLPRSGPGARARIRAELGTPEDAVVVLGVGRLHPDKRPQDFLRAVARSGATGWLAGDGPLRVSLEEAAASSGVLLLGQRPDIGDLLAAADVFALPAQAESYGLAVMEALGAGLPVVATRTGAVADLVGEAGILVDPGDGDAFVAAVSEVAGSFDLRSGLAAAAAGRPLPSPQELVRQVGAVYDEVMVGRDG